MVGEACPLCKREDQVLSLPGYWGGLSPSAANYEPLQQPPEAEVRYLYALGVAAVGIIFMVTGAVLVGLAVLAGGIGWAVVMSRQATDADHKRSIWQRSKWCGRCAEMFDPKG